MDVVLNKFLEEKRLAPFQWGVNDCCLFASDWIRLITGWDPAGPEGWALRGTYSTALSATRHLRGLGGVVSLADRVVLMVGGYKVAPRHARRGDLALIPTPHGPALGVVGHPKVAAPGRAGTVFFRKQDLEHFWRIPQCRKP
jgi:hypothetical protein